ncbi:MAG TPA: SDR family oxidoreductase [Ramlibacter sp.]|nr:SDR family oxidoreductase [Ramlibacter sp.]
MTDRGRFDIRGKVIVVTGATKGLGRAVAAELSREGASIVVCSRDQDRCERAAAELRNQGGDAVAMACHVGVWDAIPAFVDRVYERFGRVDVLVNNAAASPGPFELTQGTSALWDKVMSVNVKGPLRLASLMVPRMAAAGGGSIINVASIGATRPHTRNGHYDASKAALLNLSKVMAAEWARFGIRVNVVSPGPFRTEMMQGAEQIDPSIIERAAAATLMRRVGQPDECVGIIHYLASEASSYVTGANHVVDGGSP